MAWRTRRDLTREEQWALGPIDMPFLMLTLLLMGIGLIMLLSASSYSASVEKVSNYNPLYYFERQAVFAVLGIIAMYIVSKINYQQLRWLGAVALAIAILLLVAVLVLPSPLSITRNNARRWLNLGFTTFQPWEIAKIGVVMYFSSRLSKRPLTQLKQESQKRTLRKNATGLERVIYKIQVLSDRTGLWELVPYGVVLVIIGALLMKEPHMSGTLLVFAAAAAILFAAGIHWGWFVVGGSLMAAAMGVFVFVGGYNSSRITIWQNPWSDPSDKGFQIIQSLYAVASGGLSGQGFGLSRQKYLYLPEEQNDFIFAVVCEELGFIGATLIILLFALLVLRGYWLALHARDRFGSLLVVGITTLLAVQVFLNIAVVTNLIPATGISLPFFSYGGTALVIQLAEMGVVLSVSRQIPAPKQG